ncbi:M24 family metallopeptidase [Streptomyces atroolivaceus]|uniref:M24 family metallopeptidase n=1 Tax=Streptomyces atroolivaceus TaxID=66869 RepID=UPI0036650E60
MADLAALLTERGYSQVDFTRSDPARTARTLTTWRGDRAIEQGDMVVLLDGGLMHGYGSDTSRTVHVGEPTAEEQRVHDVVREAREAGCVRSGPGSPAKRSTGRACAVITEFGYGERFIHRTGHGMRVTTHEPPYRIEGEEHPLVPGTCFSVEPGIYLPGRFGVRVEDIVTVTESGGRRLNTTARELAVIE